MRSYYVSSPPFTHVDARTQQYHNDNPYSIERIETLNCRTRQYTGPNEP